MHPDGFGHRKSVQPQTPKPRYFAIERGITWSVYENDNQILVNLAEFQAKAIAAILNVG